VGEAQSTAGALEGLGCSGEGLDGFNGSRIGNVERGRNIAGA
jgi:hypothetical protein